MKLSYCLLVCGALAFSGASMAQSQFELESCQPLVLASEEEYNASIYEECGFQDLHTAITYWAPLAEQNEWKAALYEIYRYQNTYPETKNYLYKSAQLGYAPALILVGDAFFQQKKIPEAMRYYNAAIRSADLSEEDQGKVTGRLAMLYADPNSPYFDMPKALPLLQKAALQRQALPNNVMGMLSLFGKGDVPQNAEEAFKYFWRAILLGCPAAEENLGFFLMAKDKYINNATLEQEIMARTFSCEPVAETSVDRAPYHLSFTTQQCADLNYYAQRLVDTSLPFTGKEECAFSADMGSMAEFLSK